MKNPEQLVPKDNLVRKVAKAIDFELIQDEVAHLYCQDNRGIHNFYFFPIKYWRIIQPR